MNDINNDTDDNNVFDNIFLEWYGFVNSAICWWEGKPEVELNKMVSVYHAKRMEQRYKEMFDCILKGKQFKKEESDKVYDSLCFWPKYFKDQK